MNEETDTDAGFFLSMGKIADVDTPASTITVSNISLKSLLNNSQAYKHISIYARQALVIIPVPVSVAQISY